MHGWDVNTQPSTLLLLGLSPAAGQEATVISGQVLSAADGLPLPGATVSIPELGLEAVGDAQGRYTFTIPADRPGARRSR